MSALQPHLSRRAFLRSIAVGGTLTAASLVAACGGSPAAPIAPTSPAKPAEPAKPAAPTAAPSKPSEAPKPAAAAPAATAAPAAKAASEAKPAATGSPGGKVFIAQEADPISLDVSKVTAFSHVQAVEHIYESLVTFDERMQIQPSLAESWEIPDPTTYVFKLRRGVRWHNGREFVAGDVVYWHERMMDPATAAPYKSSYVAINRVEPVDDYTVRMTLAKPYASLLAMLASLRGSAIPNKETVQQHGDLATQAIGTGPYKLAEFVPGDIVRYVRNPDYWDKGVPLIEEMTLKVMLEEDQRIAALRAGQAHLGVISPIGAQRLAGERAVAVLRSPKAWEQHVIINSGKKPFDDVRVRKAMSMALDRQAFVDKVVHGAGTPSGPIPIGHGDWPLPVDQLPYKQDVEGAKRLMAEAGHPNGFAATIKTTSNYPEMSGNAVELKNQLKAINIDLTVEQLEWGQLLRAQDVNGPPEKPLEYDLISGAYSFFPDPDIYLAWFTPERNFFIRSSSTNMKNDRITELIDKAQETLNHEERRKMYHEIQLRMLTDQVPALFLYSVEQIDGVSDKLQGYRQSFMGRRYLIRSASMSQG
jgi:peptide/nickel transport system substrate-binding protein